MPLSGFHPAVRAWFETAFGAPTPAQSRAWPAIRAARHTLIAAPTGAGKTLAAFLAAIDDLVRRGTAARLPDATVVLYVSPLKALSNDIRCNLEAPLAGIRDRLFESGIPDVEVRTLVRTGDTPQSEREKMRRRPPHILVTTPESLYVMLTSESGRGILSTVRTVIVDEIHAVAGNKRGAHLALSLERLEALAGPGLVRIGLSATQRPVEAIARFLVGAGERPGCTIVDLGHGRERDLAIELPSAPLEPIMSNEVWGEIYDRIARLVEEHRTTLVFVNTRRLAERVARHLSERLGEGAVTSHHGSLARDHRLAAEQALKAGRLKALVATASLELGIDIGDVDLVCQLGSPRALATFLQRVGRSGHGVGRVPKGRLFPLSRDELVECAAIIDAVGRGGLDVLKPVDGALDVLAQQVVAEVACREWDEDELYAMARRAWPYRELERETFTAIVRMLSEGFSTRRGRRGAHLHRDAVNRRLRPRRGARLTALTCGGTIPDQADYDVILEPEGRPIGTVNEDFAIESLAGDVFQLGNTSYRVIGLNGGKLRVEDAHGQPPSIPFWFGEAPGRSDELSAAVSRLRCDVVSALDGGGCGSGRTGAMERLERDAAAGRGGAEQIVDYIESGWRMLGVVPSQETIVLERFFDQVGDMHLVIHAPFGSRLNRAWGLALRKRFCRKFNFELQAAATEDAIVLSLGPTHSFALEEVAAYLNKDNVRGILVQAMLDAPMFAARWRWNAATALAIRRFRNGKKAPPHFLRMDAEDLVSVVFPDQLACLENIAGERELPDHPLVNQTVADCLHEAMDIEGLERLLADIAAGRREVVVRDLPQPSPFAQEILAARPYAFLDDAPAEERRTRAVMSQRYLDPASAADAGRLDPAAIDRVRAEVWPAAGCADELHDALVITGCLAQEEGRAATGWAAHFDCLCAGRRATRVTLADGAVFWVAAERLPEMAAAYPGMNMEPLVDAPAEFAAASWSAEDALVELLRGRLECSGPVTGEVLARIMAVPGARIEQALLALESEGFVLRGGFTEPQAREWCERRVLARIHRDTLGRLRREIEPVTAAELMRFLLQWQGVAPGSRGTGPEALAAVVSALEGFEAPAASWEAILAARCQGYDPAWLDQLCLAGRATWARLGPPARSGNGAARAVGPVRNTPIAVLSRARLPLWRRNAGGLPAPSETAHKVRFHLDQNGASFLDEVAAATALSRADVVAGLSELVARGEATSDGFAGLRALLAGGRHRRRRSAALVQAGRWARLPALRASSAPPDDRSVEEIARAVLRRYGVVFRALLEREGRTLPPWRQLLRVYHRLEARGEIRGGRFVAGFSGEQFALPEAVPVLREARRRAGTGELIIVPAADPLNLCGSVLPGERVPAVAGNILVLRDGLPVAAEIGGEFKLLARLDGEEEWSARNALLATPGFTAKARRTRRGDQFAPATDA
jgi:ATP-dependent Lhr-like helicase